MATSKSMTEAALCTDGSSNLVWVTGTRRTEQRPERGSGRESRGSGEDKDGDEAGVARKMPEMVFAEVGRKWCCRIICKSTRPRPGPSSVKLLPIRVGAKVPSADQVRLLTPSVVPASYISYIDYNGYRNRSGRLCQQARRWCYSSSYFASRQPSDPKCSFETR